RRDQARMRKQERAGLGDVERTRAVEERRETCLAELGALTSVIFFPLACGLHPFVFAESSCVGKAALRPSSSLDAEDPSIDAILTVGGAALDVHARARSAARVEAEIEVICAGREVRRKRDLDVVGDDVVLLP